MLKRFLMMTIAIGFVLPGVAHAAYGDVANGKALSEACWDCHGEGGKSEMGMFPRLSGLRAEYIVKQLRDFQVENRMDDTMGPMAAMVEEGQDMKDVAAYFASFKMEGKPGAHKSSLADKGKALYYEGNPDTGVYACVNCHGKDGDGKKAWIFPVLGGQYREYLVKQLTDFKEGTRVNDPALMMAKVAKMMSDEEIEAVSEYLSGSSE